MGSSYSVVDSAYLYAKDLNDKEAGAFVSNDDQTASKLNVWSIKDPSRIELLKRMLKPEDLSKLCVLVLVDFSEPWELMNSMQKWFSEVRNLASHLMKELPFSEQERLKKKLRNEVLTYEEPPLDPAEKESSSPELLQLKKELPLPPSCLSVNLGVPLITVVTKTDSLLHGPLRSYLDQHCLFIQRHLRLHCLPYASALVFVSAKTGTNVGRLYQYILSRLFDKEGREGERAEVVDKHALFIPTGWDSLNLIGKQEGEEEEVYERTVHRDEQGVQVDRDIVTCESWQ